MINKLPQVPQANKLLLDESPLIVQKSLAKLLTLEAAIVLQQIHYLIFQKLERLKDHPEEINRDVHDGKIWLRNTYKQWQSNCFSFISIRSLQRVFLSLENQGLILSANYNQSKLNKTKSYTVNYDHPLLKTHGSITKNKNSFSGKIRQHKSENDNAKLALSSCQIGNHDAANLVRHNTKKSTTEETTTTDRSSLKIFSKKEIDEPDIFEKFPVPKSDDEMKDIVRDVIAITYPAGEKIINISNLVHSLHKKLIRGQLNIPVGWTDFQKKKKERMCFNQTSQKKDDEIDFEKAKKDFSALPENEQNKYLDAAKQSAKFCASEMSEATIHLVAINLLAKEKQAKT